MYQLCIGYKEIFALVYKKLNKIQKSIKIPHIKLFFETDIKILLFYKYNIIFKRKKKYELVVYGYGRSQRSPII